MKSIIFDIDGTIFDTKNGIINCLNDVISRYGDQAIVDCNKYIGPPIKESLIKYNGFPAEKAEKAISLYRELYVSKYIEYSIPYPGLFDTLSYCKDKKYKLCIATLKTKNQVDVLLRYFNITDYFDQIETAKYEGGYSKRDMLESIKSKCHDDELFFIGDTAGDYNASLNAGITFIFAKYGYGGIEENNCLTIDSLEEIKNIV